jgi:hypothetical protein
LRTLVYCFLRPLTLLFVFFVIFLPVSLFFCFSPVLSYFVILSLLIILFDYFSSSSCYKYSFPIRILVFFACYILYLIILLIYSYIFTFLLFFYLFAFFSLLSRFYFVLFRSVWLLLLLSFIFICLFVNFYFFIFSFYLNAWYVFSYHRNVLSPFHIIFLWLGQSRRVLLNTTICLVDFRLDDNDNDSSYFFYVLSLFFTRAHLLFCLSCVILFLFSDVSGFCFIIFMFIIFISIFFFFLLLFF